MPVLLELLDPPDADTLVARASGALDSALVEALEPLIEAVEARQARRVVLDVSDAVALRSGGLAPLIRLGEGLRARGGGLALIGARPRVARVCELVAQGHFFALFPDLGAALAGVPLRPVEALQPPPAAFSTPRPPDETFRVTIRAGAVMPTGRQQTLSFDQTGLVRFQQQGGDAAPIDRPFYGGEQLIDWLAAWVEALVAADRTAPAGPAAGVVDGDYLVVEAEHQGRSWRRSAFNAYDPVLCTFVEVVHGPLPDQFHVAYSQLDAARLRL